GDLVGVASDVEVVQKSGSWYAFGETRLGQGKEKAVEFLAQNPELLAELREQTLAALKLGKQVHRTASYEVEDVGADDSGDASEDAALEA
ncbi:MAG TPA: hypothetical protein VKA00_05995, partial [Trueperaceae bacterium]|nr:hypothetical protein [Trueperaceae bacterium]